MTVLAGKTIGWFLVQFSLEQLILRGETHLHCQNLWMIKFSVTEIFFFFLSANKICVCTKAVLECTEIKPAINSIFCDPAGIFFKLGNTEVCVLSDLNREP